MSVFKKHKYHVWARVQDKYPLMFFIAAIVLIVISILGVIQVSGHSGGGYRNIPDIMYKVLQVILFETGEIIDDPAGWTWIGISRVAAPLLTIAFSLLGIALLFTNALKRFHLRYFRSGHTVVIGFGANSREFIRSLGEGAQNCVMVASNLLPEDQAFLAEYHVFLYQGTIHTVSNLDRNKDMRDDGTFFNRLLCRSIAAHKANQVIVFTDDDGFNIRAANVVAAIFNYEGGRLPESKNAPRIVCGINDLATYQQVIESGLLAANNILAVNFDIFCAHDALQKIRPLNNLLCADKEFKPVHLVVLGFGSLGRALAKTFAEVGCYSDSGREEDKPIVTILDQDALSKTDLFLGLFPEIHQVIRIRKFSLDIESLSALRVLQDIHREAEEKNMRPVVVVTVNNPTFAASHVMKIASKFMDSQFEFFIRILDIDPHSGWLIKQGKLESVKKRSLLKYMEKITSFGNAAALYSEEQLSGVDREENAKSFHEAYEQFSDEARNKNGKKTYGVTPWEKLDPLRRYSNFCALDHVFHKLTALNNPASIDESQIEDLAKLEHVRWNAERFTAGWKAVPPAVEKDIPKKLNPCLVPWDDLTKIKRDDISYQEYDRVSIRTMIRFLEKLDSTRTGKTTGHERKAKTNE